MTDPIVSTAWLAERRARPGLVVLDCTYYLPAERRNARAEFAAAHIPGAGFFDIDVFADPEGDQPHPVPSAARFARLAGELGIGNGSDVVFYDQKGLFSAARGWWLMGLFGHDRAWVLDGGLPRWREEEREVESGEPATTPATFHAAFRAERLRGLGDLRRNLDNGAELVLDARAAARFAGAQPEPRAGLRAGHVPGSRNVPYTELLDGRGGLRSAEELHAILRAAGAGGERPVVTSCGSGVTAAVITLALRRAGLPEGALYDGSWCEWGSRPDMPVATGDATQ